jgi:hypothetical protein
LGSQTVPFFGDSRPWLKQEAYLSGVDESNSNSQLSLGGVPEVQIRGDSRKFSGFTGQEGAKAPRRGRALAVAPCDSVPQSLHAVPTHPNLARFSLYDILETRNALKKMALLLGKTVRRS